MVGRRGPIMRKLVLSVAAGLALATPAAAGTLNRASEGWVYFHRAGATPEGHQTAVAACLVAAHKMGAPYVGSGVVGAMISGMAQNAGIAPDVENCMVSAGWEVVRLDDAEGAAIGALDQPGQAKALAPWIGAESVHGTVVRRFEPLARLKRIVGMGELSGGRLALSVTATPPFSPPAKANAPEWKLRARVDPQTDPAKAAPGSAFIVIRLVTHALPNMGYGLIRFDEAAHEVDAVSVDSPTKLFMKTGADLERTYVAAVQPGRWHLIVARAIALCLGTPAFDIAPGEVLFAGTFTAGADDPYSPDMSLEPARAALKDADLKARLRPAPWVNGNRYDCDAIPNQLNFYRVDFPGFPARPDNPPPPY